VTKHARTRSPSPQGKTPHAATNRQPLTIVRVSEREAPDAGQAVRDHDEWAAVPNNTGPLRPFYADETLAFNMAVTSPDSASTLSIVCYAMDFSAAPTEVLKTVSASAVVTAVQTSTNK